MKRSGMTASPVQRGSVTRACVQCGEMYEATKEHRGYARRFCSSRCAGDYQQARARESWPAEEEVRQLYEVDGLSDRELGARFGRSYQWAFKVREAYGIAGRSIGHRSAATKAKPRVQSNGYVKVGDEWQHRLVVAESIGRPLVRGESVHHIDGDPTNNATDNLVLYPSHSEHQWDEKGRTARRPRSGTGRSKRRDWTEPRQKVEAEGRCRVCARTEIKLDAAHIIPRSRVAPGPGEHPDNIVPLCAERCHPAFDRQGFDLLPFLTLGEQAYATGLVGLVEAYQRLTNQRLAA